MEPTGVEVNGSNPWDIQVHRPELYDRLLRDASLGLGESYVEGWWDCQAFEQLITRVLLAQLDEKVRRESRFLLQALKEKLFNRQSRSRAFEVGIRHYDLGNDLYTAMLDKRMAYACDYWKTAANLDDAQVVNLDLVCRKIGLRPGMRNLELGCGWGSFAKYAAENYGVSVLGLTVSKEQVALGVELCWGLPVELRLLDYCDATGEEEEFVHPGASNTCHLWSFQDELPGYAWYFPKTDSVVNVGVGGGSIGLKKQQDNLKRHWELLVDKLERYDLVRGHDFRPVGHSYYLRSSSPAIRSGINAADAIIHATAYTTRGLHRYSFPDLLGWRR